MKYCALISLVFLLCGCATGERSKSYGERYAENLLTVPDGARWSLIGEWDLPESDGWLNFTRSIVLFNGKYVEVSSGRVVTGCCYWPQGIHLKQLGEKEFLNPVSEAIYSIGPDGSLNISNKDGSTSTLVRTAPEYSLTRRWSKTKD